MKLKNYQNGQEFVDTLCNQALEVGERSVSSIYIPDVITAIRYYTQLRKSWAAFFSSVFRFLFPNGKNGGAWCDQIRHTYSNINFGKHVKRRPRIILGHVI